MIRALIYLILLGLLAAGLSWFADRPGDITIDWLSYQIQVSLFWTTVAIVIAATLMLFVFTFISRIVSGPRRLRRHMKKRRRERGLAALRRGIFAVGAGDEATAARYAIEARRALPNEPLSELLRAQSAQLSGDYRTAQRIFEAMAEKPDSRLLGLRGLFLEASREGQTEAAQQYAAKAMALNPALPWPVHALFDMQCRARDWQSALETLTVARNHRHLDRKTVDRRRAVLLTAQAQDLEATQPSRAAELAGEAHRIAPDFVPAAVIAGRILAGQGNSYKAARVLARTWQYTPHPDLAVGYAYARPGDSPHDRLARIRSLIVLTPDHVEARIALASAAVDARQWAEAREALQPLLAKNPTARVCALMARIEGGENRDAGRVREWLARAVRAPRDPVWMAEGVASGEWQPISPVTGALDAFEWRVPPDPSKPGAKDALLDDVAALGQELEAVTRKIAEAQGVEAPDDSQPGEPLTITVKAEEVPAAEAKSPPAPEPVKPVPVPNAESIVVQPSPQPKKSEPAPEKPAAAAEIVAEAKTVPPAEARPPAAPAPTPVTPVTPLEPQQARMQKKNAPKIFVPDRPPDDPGPGSNEIEEPNTPYARFRSSYKPQTT